MGRTTKRIQRIGPASQAGGFSQVSHEVTQSYWLSGLTKEIQYPTSTASVPRMVSYEYWPNGQARKVWQGSPGTGTLYAEVSAYDRSGAETAVALGNGVECGQPSMRRLPLSTENVPAVSAFSSPSPPY